MTTVLLQSLSSVLALVFGLLALGLGRRLQRWQPQRAAAWLLTGIAFTAHGALYTLHTSWAALAFVRGPAAPLYQAYVTVAPSANHARALLLITFALLLHRVVASDAPPRTVS